MNKLEAWQAIKNIGKVEFIEKIKPEKLSTDRQDILFKFIQGETDVSYSCRPDIEEYALKVLMPEIYESLPHEGHLYSSCEIYEYDPPKNGQNIIKHGLGFGEVVSYSTQFGALLVPCPDNKDGTRYVILSDLTLERESDKLALPPAGIREINYTISIAHRRHGKFRFISARLISSKKKKYEETIAQALGEIITDEQARQCFIHRCVNIAETNLFRLTTPIARPY